MSNPSIAMFEMAQDALRKGCLDEAALHLHKGLAALTASDHVAKKAKSPADELVSLPRHYASNIQSAAAMLSQSGSFMDQREAEVLYKIVKLMMKGN